MSGRQWCQERIKEPYVKSMWVASKESMFLSLSTWDLCWVNWANIEKNAILIEENGRKAMNAIQRFSNDRGLRLGCEEVI